MCSINSSEALNAAFSYCRLRLFDKPLKDRAGLEINEDSPILVKCRPWHLAAANKRALCQLAPSAPSRLQTDFDPKDFNLPRRHEVTALFADMAHRRTVVAAHILFKLLGVSTGLRTIVRLDRLTSANRTGSVRHGLAGEGVRLHDGTIGRSRAIYRR
jgi:hypothetical protein